MKSTILHKVLTVFFVTFILAAFAIQYIPQIKSAQVNENRKLAELPEFKPDKLDPFPTEYEQWFSDHFKLKKPFLGIASFFDLYIFRKANLKNKAIRGKEDYIFEMAKDFPVYTGKKKFREKELQALQNEFIGRLGYFDSLGVKCYFLLAPNKYSVMNDKLPFLLSAFSHNRTDDFVDRVSKLQELHLVDGRQVLNKNKRNHKYLFRKFDTHWTRIGAFLAWQELSKIIHRDFPEVKDFSLSSYQVDSLDKSGGNLCWVMGNDEACKEIDFRITLKDDSVFHSAGKVYPKPEDFPYNQNEYCQRYSHRNTLKSKKLKALVIHDSFTVMLRDIIPAYFNETLFIWDSWKYRLKKEIIEAEQPDILIYIVNETYLERILMEPSFVPPMDVETQLQ